MKQNSMKNFSLLKMCIVVGDVTGCHPLCKTCLPNSYCGLENVCTSCHPKDYKISSKFNDQVFKCSNSCAGEPLQHDDYFYCDGHMESITSFNTIKTRSALNGSDNRPLIIIVIVISIIFSLFLINIAYKFNCKKKNLRNSYTEVDSEFIQMQPMTSIKVKEPEQLVLKKIPMISNTEEFEKLEDIGGGNYSIVYKGTLNEKPVAIKVARDEGRRSIYRELKIYDKLSHPNILPALGVFLGVDNMLFLALRPYNLRNYFIDYAATLTFLRLKQYCIQIADAMKYLHKQNILHCDLKIDNILMKDDNGEQIEISDFGCAIDLENDHRRKFVGTQTHTAYELLKHMLNPSVYRAEASKASDVWSFAVTMWQIFQKNAEIPQNFVTKEDIIKNYEAGKKLPKPDTISEDFWRYIVLPCFDLHPSSRPSMEDLYDHLLHFREPEHNNETSNVNLEKSTIKRKPE